jgi:hypothetical protein
VKEQSADHKEGRFRANRADDVTPESIRRLYDRDLLAVDLAANKIIRRCPEPQRLVNQPRAEVVGKLSNILPEFSAGMKVAALRRLPVPSGS